MNEFRRGVVRGCLTYLLRRRMDALVGRMIRFSRSWLRPTTNRCIAWPADSHWGTHQLARWRDSPPLSRIAVRCCLGVTFLEVTSACTFGASHPPLPYDS